jgi:4a-hydroxytetrahydrobiopterin dehydratase
MPTPPYNDEEVYDALKSLSGWEHQDNRIIKTYAMPTYLSGLTFAAAVGTLAEAADHHPDLYIGYKKVRVELSTHDAGNRVSRLDIELAKAIEGLRYPRT